MAFTTEQLEELEKAIASPAGTVEYTINGETRRVVNRDLPSLLKLRDQMRRELGLAGASQVTLGSHSKGL